MKLIFNPDLILSSSFDGNRQTSVHLPLSKTNELKALDRLGRGREWYFVSVRYYRDEVEQQLVLEVHGKL
jgi:hypothetical protein